MSHKKRKSKPYRPMASLTNPLSLLLPAPREDATMLLTKFHMALEMMARGQHPGVEEWRDIADIVNTVETLCVEQKLLPLQVMPWVQLAAHAMANCGMRHHAGRGFRLDGPGMLAIQQVLNFYIDALGALTARDMGAARALTEKRMAAYRSGAPVGVDVVSV